ncbi:O-succinylbenzoic acid--CoA ligase [Moritella sp. JT01]|uniref:o-succinylbenzoate--CoA ligase n=1 Tax=Moritella sp. JT01 TaxID=756698 RepID=UPI000795B531|nr:o-succinylbenzoate--CoA ligase [Moritella sp. JT01]KXO13324.1 O-succinylbenzoic acid--CoA ligase [Moritella sp. JT01]
MIEMVMNDNVMDTMACHEVGFNCWPWQHWSSLNPDGIALVYGEYSFTWQHVNSLVDEYAKQLNTQGLRQDHIVAAVSVNNPDVLWLYLACLRLGACCVVLDPKQSAEQLSDKFEALAAQFVWVSAPAFNRSQGLQSTNNVRELVFTLFPSPSSKALSTRSAIAITASTAATKYVSTEDSIKLEWQAERLASIVFTSGSTGKAKAVAHSGENHLYSAAGLLSVFSYTAQDSWLMSLPLFHVSGLAIVWRWLLAGGQLVLPSADSLVEQLSQVTHASLVPTQLRRYLNELDVGKDVISLKRILLGGAVIPVVLTDKAKSLGIDCWSGYGMTEMASTVTAKPADDSAGVGTLLAHRCLCLINKQIKVRGRSLGMGYYYQGALRPITDESGWLVTGDLGMIAQGDALADELFILGRQDNMFISGGENIHPEQIERILLSHPFINQALVFPCEDVEFGHRPIAVIDAIGYLSVDDMNKFLQNKLVKFMWPINYYSLPDAINVRCIKLNRAFVQLWVTSLYE